VGNTVGSLSEVQRAIVVGTLLGDGAMRCKANALLEINHCMNQREYVDWKFSQLSELVRTPPQSRQGNGKRIAYRFVTRSPPELTPYYRTFYGPAGKRVPEVVLSPLSLAVWFMDDGCRSRRAVYLNTQQFALADQHRLLDMLQVQWKLDGTLNRDKTYYRIRLSVDATSRFAELIKPHLLPMFLYKLPQVTP
jgi:recombination protein RecA